MNYIIFSIIFLTSFISAQLLVFLFLNKNRIYLRGFFGLIISILIYSFFYSLELISPNLSFMKIFAGIQYIGILSIPAFWIIMALEYTSLGKYINRYLYIEMFILPVLLVILNFTNDYHHLFYKNYTYNVVNNLSIANIEPGIGYIISGLFINACFIIGNLLYIRSYIQSNRFYKRKYFILMLSSFIPWFGYLVYRLDLLPLRIDVVPVFIAILCLFYIYFLLKSNVFDIVSIARNTIFDNISESILILDEDNKIIDMNNKAEAIFNMKSKLMIGKNIEEFNDYEHFVYQILNNKNNNFDSEIIINNESHYFKCEVTLLNNKDTQGKVIVLSDNTEQVLLIKKLEYLSTTDILTGVYNRNYFYKLANEKIQSFDEKDIISLIMMDIDNFKSTNDTYGHIAGDLVLKKVMDVCIKLIGNDYYIGRYGGEEFIILLDNVNSEKALDIGENLRYQIQNSCVIYENKQIKTTSSFGIFTTNGKTTLDIIVKNADKALYEAKRLGRNKVVLKIDDKVELKNIIP
ncbi:histidine kinase N-terminal 7TM domain-containing diguanylate cyclase [Anaerovorax odorimutans]|uniref:histidine kinase N-terminal 7TM domain-containing diguanylate cyclase n=1 Tax=Anaerovorax odorimutans TaxID=109327 RepID=UPI001FE11B29|nr:histidine kinase N-terminal 7TM domain-containing protein [Anaerovorax odorimutans]